mmetsp:Transcript_48115/g.76054  ORF Transcript_48115/g.76054 Transcript_48115/m.76054 type:complete len:490 (+) Transcript_48115:63-1532(+)
MPTLMGTLRLEEEVPLEPKPRCMPMRSWVGDAQPLSHNRCPRGGYPTRVRNTTWRAPYDEPPDLPPKVSKPQLTLFLAAPKPAPPSNGSIEAALAKQHHRNRRARSLDSSMPTSSQLERISVRDRSASKTLPTRREKECMKADRDEAVRAAKESFGVTVKVKASNSVVTLMRSPRRTTPIGSLRRCNSSGAAALQEPCPVCFADLRPTDMESLGCDIHYMCSACASYYATEEVRSGRLPRCVNEKCRKVIEPLVALRLFSQEDHSLYLQMALWLNPRVEACPKCHELLFSEQIAPCGLSARCPNCDHVFCADCRNPRHPGQSCKESYLADCLSDSPGDIVQLLKAGVQCKICPRCRMVVEKADEDSCDHMTCLRCHHEFCWVCSADRSVIYAHGNHYHRMSCKHYAPYSGPEEYLPNKCVRCKLRGSACRAPSLHVQRNLPPACSVAFETFVDVCSSFTRDSFNRAMNSNFMRVHFQNKPPLAATELSL